MSELTPEQKKDIKKKARADFIYALHAGRRNSFVLGAFLAVNSVSALNMGASPVICGLVGLVSFLTIKDAVALHEHYKLALENKDEKSEEEDV